MGESLRAAGPPAERPLDEQVLHRTENGVSWITLNRPEAMNAVTWEQRERVIALLDAASADPGVRAVVLTSAGRGFCAGADLRAGPRTGGERVAGDVARMIRQGAQRLVTAVLDCEKPVVAAVGGTAAGIGA
ncbi:enoyl-CoA hydratase/isomerase family protein, partial [Streptomyces toxytricini]